MKTLTLLAALLLALPSTAGDEYWALLRVPMQETQAQELADQATALTGVLGAVEYGLVTEAGMVELAASSAALAAAIEAEVETIETSGTTTAQKVARRMVAGVYRERTAALEDQFASWLGRHAGAAGDLYTIIQLDVDPALTAAQKLRLKALLEGRREVREVIAAP